MEGSVVPDLNIPLIDSTVSVKGHDVHTNASVIFNQGMLVHENPMAELDREVQQLSRKKIHLESNVTSHVNHTDATLIAVKQCGGKELEIFLPIS